MAHRKFGQGKTNPNEPAREPVTFDMAHEEGIQCRDYANGKLLMELIGKVEAGSVGEQTQGILQIFDVVVRTDDGDHPDKYTGRRYDSRRPLANHTEAELDAIDEENAVIRERNDEIADRNRNLEEGQEPEELEQLKQPGIDPTSSWGRLQRVLDDPNTRIEVEELAEVVGWLVEQYTGRPTRNAAGSRGGTSSTNRGSRRASRNRALTSVTSNTDG